MEWAKHNDWTSETYTAVSVCAGFVSVCVCCVGGVMWFNMVAVCLNTDQRGHRRLLLHYKVRGVPCHCIGNKSTQRHYTQLISEWLRHCSDRIILGILKMLINYIECTNLENKVFFNANASMFFIYRTNCVKANLHLLTNPIMKMFKYDTYIEDAPHICN